MWVLTNTVEYNHNPVSHQTWSLCTSLWNRRRKTLLVMATAKSSLLKARRWSTLSIWCPWHEARYVTPFECSSDPLHLGPMVLPTVLNAQPCGGGQGSGEGGTVGAGKNNSGESIIFSLQHSRKYIATSTREPLPFKQTNAQRLTSTWCSKDKTIFLTVITTGIISRLLRNS